MPVSITVFAAGPAAVREDWDSRLLSTGGIQRHADDTLTGHHVDNLELITYFYKGTPNEVRVPMFREHGGSYVQIRAPRRDELEQFMLSNADLAQWTPEALFTGKFNVMHASVRETFHAMMPHLGDRTLDNMIKFKMLDNLDGIPLSKDLLPPTLRKKACGGCLEGKGFSPGKKGSWEVKKGQVATDIMYFDRLQLEVCSGARVLSMGPCLTCGFTAYLSTCRTDARKMDFNLRSSALS
jgi:hypothetical protein